MLTVESMLEVLFASKLKMVKNEKKTKTTLIKRTKKKKAHKT